MGVDIVSLGLDRNTSVFEIGQVIMKIYTPTIWRLELETYTIPIGMDNSPWVEYKPNEFENYTNLSMTSHSQLNPDLYSSVGCGDTAVFFLRDSPAPCPIIICMAICIHASPTYWVEVKSISKWGITAKKARDYDWIITGRIIYIDKQVSDKTLKKLKKVSPEEIFVPDNLQRWREFL